MRVPRRARGAGAAAYKHARPPRGRTPWRDAGYCAVDLELSGLDARRDEIISFGAIPIEEGRAQLSAAVEGLVRPERSMSESSIRIHGLRARDLAGAPPLDVAIDPLLAVMAGRIPVVHVAAVERSFLTPALRRQGLRLRRGMIDTSVLGLVWLHERDGRGPRRTTLTDLAVALGLPVHHPHDAVGDALTTAQVFIALAMHLDAQGAETVRSLTSAGARLESLLSHPSR
ncbi:MAG TPA: exonuclease domain-containing protein [Solirubrobacteraceae bacterium]|nr:exonuclease domain-containing protein [Solirubrobacteraceae bacterium]